METIDAQTVTDHETHPLESIFADVVQQVMYGKGERHGGARVPFLEQSWMAIAKVHGAGFLTGQAQKKMNEAVMSENMTQNYAAWEREMLGAIAYMGMTIIFARQEFGVTPVL